MNKSSIDPNSREKFSRKEWEGKLALLIQQSIPLALRENQSANSISNFDVQNFVKGYFDDIGLRERGKFGFSTAFSNPNVIFEKLLELGAEDMSYSSESIEIITSIDDFDNLRDGLVSENHELISAEISMIPKNSIKIEGKPAEHMLKMLETLEECDDVQNVYSNFDIDDEIIEAIA